MVSLRVRRVRNIGADLTLGALLPLSATATLTGQRLVGETVLGVCLVVLAVRWAQERRRLEFRWEVLGQYVEMRALATASVAGTVVGAARQPSDALGAALAALVLGALLVCEPRLLEQAERDVPVVANLPGVPDARERPVSQLTMVVLEAAAVLAGLVVAVLGLPGLVWALLTLVPAGYALVIAREAARRSRLTRELMTAAPAAVEAYAPDVVLHTAHAGPNYHQVMMWLPYLLRTGLKVMVVTRFRGPSRALLDRVGDVPLVQAPELTDLDAVMVPSVRAVFYPNAKLGNSSAIRRYPWIRHVFVNHGDSDKATAYAPSHASYDKIFAAGPAAVRRYGEHGVTIAPEKFEVVGRPQAEGVEPARGPIGELDALTVLYAPTWKGFTSETSISSVSMGVRIVEALLRTRARVVFRPHPSSYNFVKDRVHIAAIHALLAQDAERTGRAHVFGPAADRDLDSVGCMNLSDAMVSDLSAVAVDYLISGKPLAMVAVGTTPEDFVRRFPMSRGDYLVHRDLGNIDALLETMLTQDPLAERRQEVRDDLLGDFPAEGYASHFVEAARRAGTTTKRGVTRPSTKPAASPAAAGGARPAGRPTTLRARLGQHRRDLAARARTAPRYAWCASLLLGSGALAAGSTGHRWTTAVLVVLVTALLVRTPVEPRRPRTLFRLVGVDVIARAFVVVAVLAAVAPLLGLGAGALLACGLGAAVCSERLVRGWSEQWPLTRNIPGTVEGRGEPYPGLLVAATAAVELVVLLAPQPVAAAVLGLVLVLAAVAVAVMALVRIGNGKAVDAAWRSALAAYDPRFAVFVGTNVNPGDNLTAWLPFLTRLGQRFAVITHHTSTVEEVDRVCRAAGLEVPIVHRPKLRTVDRAVTPGMNAVFYVHSSVLNNQMVSRREVSHVLLNHRESEGVESWNPMAAMYDQVFVPGQVARERFAAHDVHIPDSSFRLVGRPQTGDVLPRRAPATDEPPAVLYLPTWFRTNGSRPSSLPDAPALVAALLARGVRVLFRPDPSWSRYRECRPVVAEVVALLEADQAATGRAHVVATKGSGSRKALVGLMNASTALMSDTVAPLYDYLRSDKPFALLFGVTGPDAHAPVVDVAYPMSPQAPTGELLDALVGSDPLAGERRRVREAYLGPGVDDPDPAAAFVRAACAATAARPVTAYDEDTSDEED